MYNTLIVLENNTLSVEPNRPDIISFESYLRDYPKLNERKTRIINLCDTERYLSKGYYCSLLAEARHHTVLPSVKTINALRNEADLTEPVRRFSNELAGRWNEAEDHELLIYFGRTEDASLLKLADNLFRKYPAPILRFSYRAKDRSWDLQRFSFSQLDELQRETFLAALDEFTRTVWRISTRKKRYRWDMAILIDPRESVPPSDKDALARFVQAAAKCGINAELLSIGQIYNIAQYDALFIRETTAIDHYTYTLARKAEDAGVVVIDDPDSILRCCNKVYLQDAFSYQKVPCLKAEVVSDNSTEVVDALEQKFGYPMVLKMPEGSFSRGVYKVGDREQLVQRMNELFVDNALVLVQEYLYTDFDWRIGILNGRAIYACRYLMARNHWQIYNHGSKRFSSGGFETLPTFEVPKVVLDAALKAAKIIGNGLYGVDIKQKDKHAFVLEVNDNPSIDYKVEDGYLGNELYMQIMQEFQRRLEARGR